MQFGGIFKTFLEGSVDRVIYKNYIVNRRFLFTLVWPVYGLGVGRKIYILRTPF